MTPVVAQILWSMTVAWVSWWVGTHWHCPPGGCESVLCADWRKADR